MCNCNQKRTMYSSGDQESRRGMVKVKLVENNPLVLSGDITGRMYVFRYINDINWIDKRDVLSMKHIRGLEVLY
jgi:hypothetical protein